MVAVNYNGTYYYYVRNGQNDVIRLIDGDNNTIVEYAYDSWGTPLSTTGTLASTLGAQNPFRYRGYVYDAETGLYYVTSRYYDPEIGRWINADTTDVLSLPYYHSGQYNLFSYCNNGPVNDRDDDGQLSWLAKIVIGATAIAVGVGVTALTGGAALPMDKKSRINKYTPEGRLEIHKNLAGINMAVLYYLMNNPCGKQSVEYNDNRIALYVAQKGKCAVSGVELEAKQVDCHHKKPLVLGGNDSYQNLIIVSDVVHILIHSSNERTIRKYLKVLNLDKKQLAKLNKLRVMAEMPELVF